MSRKRKGLYLFLFVLLVLLTISLLPAPSFARYPIEDVVVPEYLTTPEPMAIDPVAIVEYTRQWEANDAAERAAGIVPWYEDVEWKTTCAFIESLPEHQLEVQ